MCLAKFIYPALEKNRLQDDNIFGKGLDYCLYTFPSFITKLNILEQADVLQGSPETAIISANLPGLMEPSIV